MAKYVIAPACDLSPGERLVAEVAGRKVVIFNLDGEFFGLFNRCPHQGGDLCRGRTTGLVEAGAEPGEYSYTRRGEILRCPWHGWEFDIRTGKSRAEPGRIRAKTYGVEIRRGDELFDGPYQAERVSVRVEEDYIVVEA
ncbi:Rieske (2Fe-2S) protein [Bosea sp. AS-1]|jgi:3-phenylpropionate/trans-cinnamate dioxygenase ferredoxin subunit|uniref:Rieske (2Fe-2S) protein n=1 Tax=Bosea sp. AS-1 TaxID=2015316 RepID=UPI000B78962A|nr:Rieske (2Fe-2S) protein [Bosea sp. AS-1]